jgi:hypothetical protein
MKFKNDLDRAENFIRELKYLTEKYGFYIDGSDYDYENFMLTDINNCDLFYSVIYDNNINQYNIDK